MINEHDNLIESQFFKPSTVPCSLPLYPFLWGSLSTTSGIICFSVPASVLVPVHMILSDSLIVVLPYFRHHGRGRDPALALVVLAPFRSVTRSSFSFCDGEREVHLETVPDLLWSSISSTTAAD